MMLNGFMRVLLTVSLVITIPASGAAQDEGPGPEGERWDLVAYGVDGLGPVPWNIDAALLLEGGVASGSAGGNRFSGDYELEDGVATIDRLIPQRAHALDAASRA